MAQKTTCDECDTHIKKEYAVRMAVTGDRNHRGPLYFCSEDCRETYREYSDNPEFVRQPHFPEEQMGDDVRY